MLAFPICVAVMASKRCSMKLVSTGDFLRDPTDTLLFLYEFEARAKLSDPKLEVVLEAILEMDPVEIKTLETVAGKE